MSVNTIQKTIPDTNKNGFATPAQDWRQPQSGTLKFFEIGGLQNPYQNPFADGPQTPF